MARDHLRRTAPETKTTDINRLSLLQGARIVVVDIPKAKTTVKPTAWSATLSGMLGTLHAAVHQRRINQQGQRPSRPGSNRVHLIEDAHSARQSEEAFVHMDEEYVLDELSSPSGKKEWFQELSVDSRLISFKLKKCNVLPVEHFKKLPPGRRRLRPYRPKAKSYGANDRYLCCQYLYVVGVYTGKVVPRRQTYIVEFVVVHEPGSAANSGPRVV